MPEIPLCFPQPELLDGSPPIAMHLFMACSAEGDQVRFAVIAAVAAKLLVVNLQVRSPAAPLAAPAVPPQNFLPQLVVLFAIEMQSRPLGSSRVKHLQLPRPPLAQMLVAVRQEETGKRSRQLAPNILGATVPSGFRSQHLASQFILGEEGYSSRVYGA
jgi:hypothetical protein